MEKTRLSSNLIDELTKELQDYFNNLNTNYNIQPVLVGNKIVLCKIKEEYNEFGDCLMKTIVGTPTYVNDTYNGIDIQLVISPEKESDNG